jgi:hypothetical protein
LNRRQNAPLIALILAMTLLVGAIPIAASPVIVQPQSAPAFTLDICTPLASFALGSASCSLPPLRAFSFPVAIEDRGTAIESLRAPVDRPLDAPDPPPPKSLVCVISPSF